MPVQLRAAAFASDNADAAAAFWASILGRSVVRDDLGLLLPGETAQIGLRFVPSLRPRTGLNRMHVHLTSTTLEHQRSTVARALALGACHLDVGQRPDEMHVVLADPDENAFCVIEPDNAYLAGCGFLGELACDGSREVGAFWSAALNWPLVWDQHDETAIQSPAGGTKVAWGGPTDLPAEPVQRQYFELVVADADPAAELDRLVSLGATPREGGSHGLAVLADPDGLAFRVLTR